LAACEEVVEPSLIAADPVVVIEGWLSDQPGESYVRLSYTAPFNDPTNTPPLANAQVSVYNEQTGTMVFSEQGELGYYQPVFAAYSCMPGNTYSLRVEADGASYSATAFLPQPMGIDSLSVAYLQAGPDREEGFYVSYHYQDPPSKNFHLLRLARNGIPLPQERLEIRNDQNVNGKYLSLQVPAAFRQGDTVAVTFYSLTQSAYTYFDGVNLLIAAGSPSEAVPENPKTNIVSDAPVLGFFNASAQVRRELLLP
jgi:hypothetical protein